MTMRRIEYKRFVFRDEVVVGEKERIDGRNKIYLVGRRRVLCLRVERCWKKKKNAGEMRAIEECL